MAPTVCLSEVAITRSSRATRYPRRRPKASPCTIGPIGTNRSFQLRETSKQNSEDRRRGPLFWSGKSSDDSRPRPASSVTSSSSGTSSNLDDEQGKMFLARREDLLGIVLRTMALVRRNHILQERVNALRAETRDFIRSVLNNPENKDRQDEQRRHFRFTSSKEAAIVSSTSGTISDDLHLPPSPDSTSSSSNDVTSTWYNSDWESEEGSSDESRASSSSL